MWSRPRCGKAEGQRRAHGFTTLKFISRGENSEAEQASSPREPGERAGQGPPAAARRARPHALSRVRENARQPVRRSSRPSPAPSPRAAPGGSRDAGRPRPRPAHTPARGASGARAAAQVGEWGAALQAASRRLTYLRPPQAWVAGARDNGASAANTPRVSIRGCLLPTLAILRDRGRETDGWERRERQPRRLCVPCVPGAGLRARSGYQGPPGPGRADRRRSRDTCGPGLGELAGSRSEAGTVGRVGSGHSGWFDVGPWALGPESGRAGPGRDDGPGGTASICRNGPKASSAAPSSWGPTGSGSGARLGRPPTPGTHLCKPLPICPTRPPGRTGEEAGSGPGDPHWRAKLSPQPR